MEMEGRLVPIMREGIDVVKMAFFQRLRTYLAAKYRDRNHHTINQLAGAIINELFATPNPQEPFASFVAQNRERIAEELRLLASVFPELLDAITDALRVQFLCDSQEGLDSTVMLTRAKELNLLVLEREVPLPKHFLEMVRTLGSSFRFLEPGNSAGDTASIH
jgi:hypothetical protein